MFWPRLQLTEEEKRYCPSKYYDAETGRRGVLRRIYTGFLQLTAIQRQPVFSMGIARRIRIHALTASGDLSQFRLQLQDSSGEQYLPDPVSAANLFGGFNLLPNSVNYPASPFLPTVGCPISPAPFVMEPNICLDPNQVLSLNGQGMGPFAGTNYFIEVCFHVWEFPGFYGTSAL